jgi:hypothetical protein
MKREVAAARTGVEEKSCARCRVAVRIAPAQKTFLFKWRRFS